MKRTQSRFGEVKVTLYTKPNCPLCDKALEQIELARREIGFELESINILEDEEIYFRYRHEIPVVRVGDEEVFRHRLTSEALVDRLRKGAS
ncbi:MAG: glutaredoxin family protein [Verrucomicrobiia bacterium]